MGRLPRTAKKVEPGAAPKAPGSTLPTRYTPKVAGYARGPFLDPVRITPSGWRWHDVRTYVVRHSDGLDYRAVRVASEGAFIGYWAVELLGTPLTPDDERG